MKYILVVILLTMDMFSGAQAGSVLVKPAYNLSNFVTKDTLANFATLPLIEEAFTAVADKMYQDSITNSNEGKILYLSNITIRENSSINRVHKVVIDNILGILKGDRILLTPLTRTPIGSFITDVMSPQDNMVEITVVLPADIITQCYTIICQTTVFR